MGGVAKKIKKVGKSIAKGFREVGRGVRNEAQDMWDEATDILIEDPLNFVGEALAPDINMPSEEPPAPTPDLDDATARANEAQRKKRRLGQSAGRASTLLGSKQTGMASKTLLGE
jgi:hypothetical protein